MNFCLQKKLLRKTITLIKPLTFNYHQGLIILNINLDLDCFNCSFHCCVATLQEENDKEFKIH